MKQLNEFVIQPLGFLRSWILEVGAVLGLSVGSNLLVAVAVDPTLSRFVWYASACWAFAGALLLWLSKLFRDNETIALRSGETDESKLGRNVAKRVARRPCTGMAILVAVVLLIGGVSCLIVSGAHRE